MLEELGPPGNARFAEFAGVVAPWDASVVAQNKISVVAVECQDVSPSNPV